MADSLTYVNENNNKGEMIKKIPSEALNDPEVQIIGGRIYNSENGKSCHQCRQKTRDFVVSCKKLKKNKHCTITFCHRCLLNRYGEEVMEVEKLGDWVCPKCRGICNCSCCMKKKGFRPTGMLVQTAKATGFNSVLDLLQHKGSEVLEPRSVATDLNASPKSSLPNKGLATSKRCRYKETCSVELDDGEPEDEGLNKKKEHIVDGKAKPSKKLNKKRKLSTRAHNKRYKGNIVLPQGSLLTIVAGIELPAEEIGAVLQFLEFCTAFSRVLCIMKGQPEHLLRELARERVGCWGVNSSLLQFHVKLLSLIKEEMGKESSWVKALEKCMQGSQFILDEFPMDFPIKDSFWYGDLEPSKKLKLVNFLCDEILGTKELRNWIDKQNAEFDEERKKFKEKLREARRKEKHLKQQLKDEMTKSVISMGGGASLSLYEHNDLISKIRSEADKAHAEMLETIILLPKNKQRSDVVRTEPILLEENGHVYWKLRSYNHNSNIILQDKWFAYDEEQEKVVEKHVSSLRNCRPTIHNRPSEENTSADNEGKDHYSANKSENQNCSTEAMEMGEQHASEQEMRLRPHQLANQ